MTNLPALLEHLCPDGVPFLPLDSLVSYRQPGPFLVSSTNYDPSFPTPVLTAGQTFVLGYTDESDGIYPASPENPVVIFDDFTTAFKWVDFAFKAKSSAMKLLTSADVGLADLRYLYFAMQTIRYSPQEHARQWIGTYSGFRVPVPPVEVQREIVSILDSFTDLVSELEAEIQLRQRQAHAAVRARSSSRGSGEWPRKRRVREFARQYVAPFRVDAGSQYVNLGVKWYGEGVFAREAKAGSTIAAKTLYRVKAGQFIYNRMFVTEGSFGTVPAELAHGVVSNEFPVFDIDRSVVLPEWLNLHFRDPSVVAQVARQAEGGTKSRRRWKEEQFLSFEIELPELEEQARLVRVAESFAELGDNLRAELGARRKQYEYYRDKLLTFEEAPA